MEKWKTISGYDGLYEVSNLGRIRSLDHQTQQKDWVGKEYTKRYWGKVISLETNPSGYRVVRLCMKGKPKRLTVHRLVLATFKPNKNKELVCNHIDGDKTNNNINNLEWVTPGENQKHAYRMGLVKNIFGEDRKSSKLFNKEVLQIKKQLGLGVTGKDLAQKYGVSKSTISMIKHNHIWRFVQIND